MVVNSLVGVFSRDMGIDLGTANTLVFIRGKGVLIREPSVVAIEKESEKILAVGNEAKEMIGKTPGNVVAIRPMRDGVIANFEITEKMLRYFIERVHSRRTLVRPRIIICVPSGVTEVEKRAVKDAALHAGARKAGLIEEPMAAALGAGLAVSDPTGNMIVDIGGGTTEVAVISMGGIVTSRSIRIGGDELDEHLVQHVKRNYNLMIGERTAESVKIDIGSAYPLREEKKVEVRGRDLISGLPKTIEVSSTEILEALQEPVSSIINAVKMSLERTPPELAADIMDRGIMIAGGGALLEGLDKLMAEETQIVVHVAESPLECVVQGTSLVLEDIDKWERVLITPKKVG